MKISRSFVYIFSAVLLIVATIVALYDTPNDAKPIMSTILYVIAASWAAWMGFYAFTYYRSKTPQGRITGWLTLGILINALAGLVLLYQMSIGTSSGLVEALFILAYLPMFIGLSYGWWRNRNLAYPERTFGFLISWLLLLSVTFVSLIGPLIQDPGASQITKFMNALIPSFDLILILLAGILTLALWGGAFTAPWGLIFTGIFALSFGNLTLAYLSWQGLYTTGNISDLFWIGGFVLIGAGFHFQRNVIEQPRKKKR